MERVSCWVGVVFKTPVDKVFSYTSPAAAVVGLRVLAPFGKRELVGIVVEVQEQLSEGVAYEIKSIIRLLDTQPLFTDSYLSFAKNFARYNFCSLGEALFAMIPAGYSEKTHKSLDAIYQRASTGSAWHVLNEAQQLAYEQIAFNKTKRQWFYLFGNTGSGKTLIFLNLIESMIKAGRQSLYLLPEIALLTAVYSLLKERFGEEQVAILHSGLSLNQRLHQWRRILRNQVKVVLGVRSAIFAPFCCLGLIIIDEEHDSSYKSQATPRYHARQVAMQLAPSGGDVKLVLGSATPSLESYAGMQQGIFQRIDLAGQAGGGQRAEFKIVDMRLERSGVIFSQQLVDEVWRSKKLGKQSAIFINRLGFGRFYVCASCGYEAFCPHCSVSLTYYQQKKEMRCHYCGHIEPQIEVCPSCASANGEYKAFGIELVEQEARRIFVGLSVVRVDSGVARQSKELSQALRDFSEGKIDILIGTQMVAKGFNFPYLRLVAVALADVGLNLPDFRATERLFSFFQQVAGRTGRYHSDGLVIAQTYVPNQMALQYTMRNDTEGFLRQELLLREQTGFPPFSRMLRLVLRGSNENKVIELAHEVAAYWHDVFEQQAMQIEILGPSEAVLSKVSGKYRWQVLFRVKEYKQFLSIFIHYGAQMPANATIYCEIEHDPLILL